MSDAGWLVKSEPEVFSIQDLERAPKKTTRWDAVRNYQARNYLRAMKKGDRVLFYHSNADPPGVVGLAEVVREHYPDPTALDPEDAHHDPRATAADAIWSCVDLRHVATFRKPVGLPDLRAAKGLEGMVVLRKGSRLSVQPVTGAELDAVIALGSRR